jgi:hypothetical protein
MDTGRVLEVPWTSEMNAQQALERAYNIDQLEESDFSFGLQYFGHQLGYMVTMLDGIYDDFENRAHFWALLVNDKMSKQGIEAILLNPDDELKFDYQTYDEAIHGTTLLAVKYKVYARSSS